VKSGDRYDPTAKNGVSKRWLPGANAATYCMQGDEHDAEGNVDETSGNAVAQMEKRMRKVEAIAKALPEPIADFGQRTPRPGSGQASDRGPIDMLLVSWGSNKGVIKDVMRALPEKKIAYLHYTYMWPLKTKKFLELAKKAKKIVLVEGNKQGQLGMLLKQQLGLDIPHQLLKYDGRPWFFDELLGKIRSLLPR